MAGFVLIYFLGCKPLINQSQREVMFKEAKEKCPEYFMNEEEVKIISFSSIGELKIKNKVYFVVYAKGVLTNMLSPRGQTYILFFDNRFRFLKVNHYSGNKIPLWCNETKIYFFGTVSGVDAKEDYVEEGNVIDFKNGIDDGYLMFEYNYGSSGGIDSQNWKVKDKQIIK